MKGLFVVALLALAGCAQPQTATAPPQPVQLSVQEQSQRDAAVARGLEETRRAREITTIADAPADDRARLIEAEATRRIVPGLSGPARRRALLAETTGIEGAVAAQVASDQRGAQMAERRRQAAVICTAKGRMAAAQPAYGGPGIAGIGSAMVGQEIAGNTVASACWETFQATGIMPSY